jgi:hypothetical protein
MNEMNKNNVKKKMRKHFLKDSVEMKMLQAERKLE